MDEYKKISGDEEIVYPGKIEEAIVYTGDGRVVVEGLCKSDPKIVSCRVYWGLGSEYVEVRWICPAAVPGSAGNRTA